MALIEDQVVVPALIIMYNSKGGFINTSQLIKILSKELTLDSEDKQLLKNRSDARYTQIIRNLKSNKRLERVGLAENIDGGFKITQKGVEWLKNGGFIL